MSKREYNPKYDFDINEYNNREYFNNNGRATRCPNCKELTLSGTPYVGESCGCGKVVVLVIDERVVMSDSL